MSKFTLPVALTAILLSGTVSAPQAVAALTFQSEIPAITPVGRELQVYSPAHAAG